MDHVIEMIVCVDNDAFGVTYEDQATEVSRILRDAAAAIEAKPHRYLDPHSGFQLCLNDANGNRVGSIKATILEIS